MQDACGMGWQHAGPLLAHHDTHGVHCTVVAAYMCVPVLRGRMQRLTSRPVQHKQACARRACST